MISVLASLARNVYHKGGPVATKFDSLCCQATSNNGSTSRPGVSSQVTEDRTSTNADKRYSVRIVVTPPEQVALISEGQTLKGEDRCVSQSRNGLEGWVRWRRFGGLSSSLLRA